MADVKQLIFSFKEVAEALIKQQDIHDGVWGLYVKFGIKGANMGENEDSMRPVAMVPILELGLQRFEKVTGLSVDAAKVNPKRKN